MSGFFRNTLGWILLFLATLLYGQDEPYKTWMIREITKDSAFIGNIYSETKFGITRFYWPNDMPIPSQDNPSDGDHLFKSSLGIFTALEGTGRIYRIEPDAKDKNKLNYFRQDSTIILGYNFGANIFFDQDTLYSLGGYGIWNFSYHLRYFRQSSYGWEILPVNKPIIQLYIPNKTFYDKSTRSFYHIDFEFFSEGLKANNKRIQAGRVKLDTIFVRRLDISTKNWETLGIINPETQQIMEMTYFMGATPWGNLLSAGDRFDNGFYLVHYSSNRILQLKDKKLGGLIRDARLAGLHGNNFPERRLVYFFNDSLKILNSNKQKFAFKLSLEDFEETPHTIWNPVPEPSIFSLNTAKKILPGIGLIGLMVGLGFFYASRRIIAEPEKNEDFDKHEIKLLQAIALTQDFTVKPDDIDQLFDEGVSRSTEALKKRRSMLIRSINKKYSEQFDDEDDLIRTERLESDRRMVQYVMDAKKYARISKIIQDK